MAGIHRKHMKVAEHGVGFPSPDELDRCFVDVCAEEGGGAAWSEAARADEVIRDPGLGLANFCDS